MAARTTQAVPVRHPPTPRQAAHRASRPLRLAGRRMRQGMMRRLQPQVRQMSRQVPRTVRHRTSRRTITRRSRPARRNPFGRHRRRPGGCIASGGADLRTGAVAAQAPHELRGGGERALAHASPGHRGRRRNRREPDGDRLAQEGLPLIGIACSTVRQRQRYGARVNGSAWARCNDVSASHHSSAAPLCIGTGR